MCIIILVGRSTWLSNSWTLGTTEPEEYRRKR
jgi:hypothetical protein